MNLPWTPKSLYLLSLTLISEFNHTSRLSPIQIWTIATKAILLKGLTFLRKILMRKNIVKTSRKTNSLIATPSNRYMIKTNNLPLQKDNIKNSTTNTQGKDNPIRTLSNINKKISWLNLSSFLIVNLSSLKVQSKASLWISRRVSGSLRKIMNHRSRN